MIFHEQEAEMFKSKESEQLQASTGTTDKDLTHLPNPQPVSALQTARKAQQLQNQQQIGALKENRNNLTDEVFLNVKYCDIKYAHCVPPNPFEFHRYPHYHDSVNSVHLHSLPKKFSVLPSVISGVGSCRIDGKSKGIEKQLYLADRKHCWPPPFFIIFISLLQIGVLVYYYFTVIPHAELNSTSIPIKSVLIYSPHHRLQLWRFFTYMVLHASWFHLLINVIVQLLYGLPLEIVYGSARIGTIYSAGVLAGSLGTSVIDSEVYLVGASGGVYALLAAQLANIMLNFEKMRYGISHLLAVLTFVFCDTSYAIYNKFILGDSLNVIPSVSYIAHLTGSVAGFTIGLLVLTNFEYKIESNLIRWFAFGVYASFTLFAIVFNLVNTVVAQELEQEVLC